MNFTAEHVATLRLIRTPQIGPQTFWKLVRQFQSPIALIENWNDIQSKEKRKIPLVSEKEIFDEIEKTLKAKGQFLFYLDQLYPAFLTDISEAPPVLSYKGNLDLLSKKMVAIVGARNGSSHGCRLAYLIAKELGELGWTVVSGLARGIDASAHQGSLTTGTISILGNGLSVVYPEENKKLYESIGERGLLMSEFSFNTEPHIGYFPKRNKLIAALSAGIIVMEAANQSGSLLTAQYGLEMGKEIFAVPGSPLDPRCRGSNRLIKQGAVLIESAQDVLEVDGLRSVKKKQRSGKK